MRQATATSLSVSKRAVTGAGWIIAWRMVTRNIGLVSTLILVRLLQPSDFGLVALAGGFVSSVDALSAIGVQDALIRAPAPDRDMYDTGFCLGVLRGFLTALIIAAIAMPVGAFFADGRLAIVMLALSAGTLISAFENIGTVDFRRDLAFRKEFNMQFWSRVIGTGTTISVAAIWHSYWALVAGISAGRAARLLLSYLMSSYRPRATLRAWRRLIGFSLWTWAQTMLYQVRDRADNVFIGRFLGAASVGMFSVGVELGSLPTTEIVEPLGRALFSGFALLHNADEGLESMFLGAVGFGFLLILPAGIGISMVADPMVRLLLGQQWITAVPVVQIIAVAGPLAIFSYASGTLLNAIGRPHITFYVGIASTAARVMLLLVLVTYYGLRGAAVALAVSAVVDAVLCLALTLPRAGISLRRLAACALRPIIASSVMVVVLSLLDIAWYPSTGVDTIDLWVDLGFRSGVGAVCYLVALMVAWIAMGRPDGAEYHVINMATNALGRIRRLA